LKRRILLVDDESYQLQLLKAFFESKKYTVECAGSKTEALEKLADFCPDLILTDFAMPDGSGLELVLEAKKIMPQVASVIATSYGSIRAAVDAIRRGVDNYLEKPVDLDLLELILNNIFEGRRLAAENKVIRDSVIDPVPSLLGNDPKVAKITEMIEKVAPLDTTVLITGETGTGKEVVSSLIWRNSERCGRTYLKINCAAIPETLFESELFGHEKGAFTGAAERKPGIIESANGGTLLLDEIGEMPAAVQPKLLRFLESREYFRVGSSKPQRADVRMIFATKRDLSALVAEQKFREDLYFRINVVNIHLPPLRDRKKDILEIFDHFIKIIARRINKPVPVIDADFIKKLTEYEWPGNVRELINSAERLLIFSKPGPLSAEDFSYISTKSNQPEAGNNILKNFGPSMTAAVEELEKAYMERALKSSANQSEAALKIGVSERVMRYKMKKYGL